VVGNLNRKGVDAGVLLALAAAAVLFWWFRIVAPASDAPFDPTLINVDFFTYTVPVATDAADALRHGELPLWNPYQSAGHPSFASMPFGALYPLNFAFLLLPAPAAIEATVVIHLVAAGAFMFLYARAIPLGLAASTLAAVTFMLGGFVSTRAAWFTPALAATVWLPLAFLAIDKIFRGRGFGWALVLAVAVAMPILAGWIQIWFYAMYAVGLYGGLRLVALAWRRRSLGACVQPALLLAAGGALGASLAAVQLLPTYELQSLTTRSTEGIPEAQLLLFGGDSPKLVRAQAVDAEPGHPRWSYLGLVGLVLMPLSLLAARQRVLVACLWALAFVGMGVALSIHSTVYDVIQRLPTAAMFRNPQRILYLYAFAGSLLVGIGADALLERRGGRADARWWWAPAAATGVASALLLFAGISPRGFVIISMGLAVVWWLAAAPAGRARIAATLVLVVGVSTELFLATKNANHRPIHAPGLVTPNHRVLEFIRDRQGLHRTYIHSPSGFDYRMQAKQGTLARVFSITDYEPLSPARTAAFFRYLDERDDTFYRSYRFNGSVSIDPSRARFDRIDLFSVRFLLAKQGHTAFREALSTDAWNNLGGPRGEHYVVYERRDALPRAYVAHHRIAAPGDETALAAVMAPDFDPRRSVVIESMEKFAPADLPITPARILEYAPREVVIETEAPEAGHLVLTDVYYPGWEATVDGEPVSIDRANYLFRGVPVGAGRHRVTFRYRPASVRVGAGLSLAALGVFAAWGVRALSARRRSASAVVALLLAAGVGTSGCGGGGPERPNVVVVVVDTLRQDSLGAAGNPRDLSPRIDALAREGVLFEEAVTVAPRTWQSFTSILTGTYPPRHGVRAIFAGALGPRVPTLASLLGDAGYQTAAFDGMEFLRQMTGGRAFQQYVDPRSLRSKNPMRGDDLVMASFLEWLPRAREPFFAFLRLSAPHWTYVCTPIFHDQVADHDAIDHRFNAGSHGLGMGDEGLDITDLDAYRERFYGYQPTPAEREHMILHYDECVRTSDAAIGRAVDRLRERGLWDATLLVVTSDHGESFGEHGYLQHGPQVDGPVMRVPLVIRFPESLAEDRRGIRVSQLARTVDLLPTLAAALELPVPPGLDGTNLLPAVDEGRDLALSAYGEGGRAFVGIDRDLYLPGVAGKWRMLRTRDWKLIHIPNGKGGIDRLYDLRTDPGEMVDVAAENPEVVAQLRRELAPFLAMDADAGDGPTLSEEEKEQLRALGYL
jgi:arylsulfatase A-like enzyme